MAWGLWLEAATKLQALLRGRRTRLANERASQEQDDNDTALARGEPRGAHAVILSLTTHHKSQNYPNVTIVHLNLQLRLPPPHHHAHPVTATATTAWTVLRIMNKAASTLTELFFGECVQFEI